MNEDLERQLPLIPARSFLKPIIKHTVQQHAGLIDVASFPILYEGLERWQCTLQRNSDPLAADGLVVLDATPYCSIKPVFASAYSCVTMSCCLRISHLVGEVLSMKLHGYATAASLPYNVLAQRL